MEDMKIVELLDDSGKKIEFEIVADFNVNDTEYAVLRPLDDEDEAVLFRVKEVDGEPTFELIDNQEEFDNAVAAYEELMGE